ncbi:TetR/AcrR family transcriptional regulator [Planctomycetota bacterium]
MSTSSSAMTALNPSVRERILAAARTEFATHGLRASSVRSIGARAGVTAAMINYYFGGKRPLYDVIVEEAQARLLTSVEEALRGGREGDLPARLTGAYFDFLAREHDFQRLLLREVLDRGEGVSGFVHRYVVPLRTLFEDLFGRDDSAFQSVITLFGAVAGYFIYEPVLSELLGQDAMSEESLERRRRHVMDLAALLSRGEP